MGKQRRVGLGRSDESRLKPSRCLMDGEGEDLNPPRNLHLHLLPDLVGQRLTGPDAFAFGLQHLDPYAERVLF